MVRFWIHFEVKAEKFCRYYGYGVITPMCLVSGTEEWGCRLLRWEILQQAQGWGWV